MNATRDEPEFPAEIEQQAAAWIIRRDRGLTAVEQDELSEWLSADRRRQACLARHHRNWERLNQLGEWRPEHAARPNPDLLAPTRPRRAGRRAPVIAFSLLAAAAVAIMAVWGWNQVTPAANIAPLAAAPVRSASVALIEQRQLEDGSVIELNRGAVVTVNYGAHERRVQLVRGEAHFAVAKDPSRPFIVSAGGAEVRAVGTAFDVRLGSTAVEVLVTEGRVHVAPPASVQGSAAPMLDLPVIETGQCAVLPLQHEAAAPAQITAVSESEMERRLAWQPRMLDFTAAPLATVIAEFNHRNSVQLAVDDPDLGKTLVSATFRSDNVEGFVRLLEAGFGVRTERRGDTITLGRVAIGSH
jgi:transmembrane sensor